jgi:hypothetical protein
VPSTMKGTGEISNVPSLKKQRSSHLPRSNRF